MQFSTPLGLVVSSMPLAVAADTPAAGDGAQAMQWPIDPLAIVLIGISVLVAVMLCYVWGLRDRLSDAITNEKVDVATRASVLTGYSDWPLGQESVRHSVAATSAALASLTEPDYIRQRTRLTSGPIFELNPDRREAAERFVRAEKT